MANVVITGGSRGIGAAAVALFAQRGHRVTFLYEKDHAAAAAVAEKTGAAPICCDVADRKAVFAAFHSSSASMTENSAGARLQQMPVQRHPHKGSFPGEGGAEQGIGRTPPE